MSNANRDENSRPIIICASQDDGVTIVPITIHPITHRLMVDNDTTGNDNGNNDGNAMLDENGVAVWTAVSADDGESIVEVYADPATGKILINSH